MKNNHASSLFHYTARQDVLESILSTGLRVSYSREQITDNIFIALPMISFCDIPLECCEEHRQKYGSFAIGINKKWMIANFGNFLSPVHYVLTDEPIIGAYRHHLDYTKAVSCFKAFMNRKEKQGAKQITIKGPNGILYTGYAGFLNSRQDRSVLLHFNNRLYAQDYANYALGITKNYYCRHKGTSFCAYDEYEWRIVIPEDAEFDTIISKWFWNEKEYETWKQTNGNSFLGNIKIEIPISSIDYIIVPDNDSSEAIKNLLIKEGKFEAISKICIISDIS